MVVSVSRVWANPRLTGEEEDACTALWVRSPGRPPSDMTPFVLQTGNIYLSLHLFNFRVHVYTLADY